MKFKRGFKRWAPVIALLVLLAWFGLMAANSTLFDPTPVYQSSATKQQALPSFTREELLTETNKYREIPFILDPVLDDSAQRKCVDMVLKNDFEHGNWRDYIPSERKNRGENLASGYSSAKEILDAWVASPTHHKNLVSSDFSRVGFGICPHGNGIWIVQHFSS